MIMRPAMTATYQVGDGSSFLFSTALLAVRDFVADVFFGLRRLDSGMFHCCLLAGHRSAALIAE